ncbi:DDE-type integrase/transposase/recombinase [bacterium]|nr:DDE-type integrase/transposase/recombinase [bacterium]
MLQVVDMGITGLRVARELSHCAQALPAELFSDNGPEFTNKANLHWVKEHGVALCFIQPGKPTQNAFFESFIGKFRETASNSTGSWIWRKHSRCSRPGAFTTTPSGHIARWVICHPPAMPSRQHDISSIQSSGMAIIQGQGHLDGLKDLLSIHKHHGQFSNDVSGSP